MPRPSNSRAPQRPKAEPVASVKREATTRKLDAVLAAAAALIAEKGFEATSMRDVAGALNVSLAGLYHYFKSKEDLLYQIQYKTFASLLAAQEEASALPGTPEERLRRLVVGHLAFFASHPAELKVCTYEIESLTGDHYHTTEGLRRRYYRLMSHVLAELMGEATDIGGESRASRHAALYVFGMLNWIFMWYDPARHGAVAEIGDEMIDLVLHGVRGSAAARRPPKRRP
ncbi:MAG: TetR family transcriptional regulator [Gemmatimonadota bacterium]|nr:TetR family transcriptional regulator [Gemmatimonadota bacterium]MDE3127964.1 TetR family transcriptional regulator [Gemmatimonadota bacterium]MDE3173356.1 TetR family transcriptional regulator [Gemmatimonadota bacterium]MDE3214973.1 TetR family transcriptional regulator [Gemmatimonadota bacterium]